MNFDAETLENIEKAKKSAERWLQGKQVTNVMPVVFVAETIYNNKIKVGWRFGSLQEPLNEWLAPKMGKWGDKDYSKYMLVWRHN